MNRRSTLSALALFGAIAFGAGYFVGGGATAGAETVGSSIPSVLGSPAAAVIAERGAPGKINYAADIQTWFYPNSEGALMAEYVINQGLVVQIIGGKVK